MNAILPTRPIIITTCFLLFVFGVRVGYSAEVTCAFPYPVANESDLNAAITCYNAETVAGNYAINFTANISLTMATTEIDSTSSSVELTINGNGNTLDGQNAHRGLTIAASTTVTINSLTISNGRAPDDAINGAQGGAIRHEFGTLTINDSTFSNNHANDTFSRGGAIYHEQGTLEINDSIFRDNSAEQGGALLNFVGAATVRNSTFSNNSAASGGGIGYFGSSGSGDMYIVRSTFSENVANQGGGFYNNSGDAIMDLSLFVDNLAHNDGGAISNNGGDLTFNFGVVRDNQAVSNGGGFYTDGTLTVDKATVMDNSADTDGGGIFNNGTLTLTNSTLSANKARLGEGGGLKAIDNATSTLINATLYGNETAVVADGGSMTMRNTLISNGSGNNCRFVGGVTTDVGTNNMADDFSCSGFTHQNTDPQLLPLDVNENTFIAGSDVGGWTPESVLTHSLFYVSPALDAGDNGVCSAEPINNVDQRFFPRPDGASCDIGAHEGTACPTQFLASDGLTLDTAIVCFNDASVTETVVVSVTNDIVMPFFPSAITNSNAGAHLVIEGNGYFINGGATHRGFSLFPNTNVTFNALSIYNMNNSGSGGAIANQGNLTLNNSTISNSTASFGGGIINSGGGVLNLNNSTVASNTATNVNGGGGIYNSATLHIRNTIVGDNSNGDCVNIGGTVATATNNLLEGTGGNACNISGGGNITGQDPLLTPFEDNGGPSLSHGLQQGSPAIDAGSNTTCANAPINNVDQRGFPRPYNGTCDIGAIEASSCDIPQPWSAGTLAELNHLIGCYEHIVHAGTYPIDLTADIIGDPLVDLADPYLVQTIRNSTQNAILQINGNGFAVDGVDLFPLFLVDATVIFDTLTIRNGRIVDGVGAGIHNAGALVLHNSTVVDNAATDFAAPPNAVGGGVYNLGTLTVNNSTIYDNFGSVTGGGLFNVGTVTINNSTISNNQSTSSSGAGISSNGTATLTNSTMSGNGLNNSGTLHLRNSILANTMFDCFNDGGTVATVINTLVESGLCGATFSGDPALVRLANNGGETLTHALRWGSIAIDVGDPFYCSAGPISNLDQRGVVRPIDGNADNTAICDIGSYEAPDLCVTAFTASLNSETAMRVLIDCYNALTANGIYVANLAGDISLTSALPTIDNPLNGISLVLHGNGFALDGNDSVGVLAIAAESDVTLTTILIRNGEAIEGGGIYNAGTLRLNQSLVRDSHASLSGGGIHNEGTLSINSSTFSGNGSDVRGGGLSNNGELSLNHATVVSGVAGTGAGLYNSGTLYLTNTILGNNGNNRDCSNVGTILVSLHNMIEGTGDQACHISGGGNIIGQDPALGVLQDNGGLTHTYALMAGNLAIDAGFNGSCDAVDQRGVPRDDGACDIGAYEFEGVPTAVMVHSAEINSHTTAAQLLFALIAIFTAVLCFRQLRRYH